MFDFTEVGLNVDGKFFITVEPLLWDTFTQGTPPFSGTKFAHKIPSFLAQAQKHVCNISRCLSTFRTDILIKIKEINIRTYSH